jgi:glyoxylase-like metal-dependent hydrolase (beta-lactamase superfamily II)
MPAEREEPMKRAAVWLAMSLLVVSCATVHQRGRALTTRAIAAVGGADTLASIETFSVKATYRYWEPEQSVVPGGEMRFANESTLDAVYDVARGATRIDYVRTFAYPARRTFTFTEIVTSDAGYVAGIDSNGRTRQSLESNPPAHAMSGLRLAAAQRELRRVSSLVTYEMYKHPDRVSGIGDVTAGGVTYPAVEYRATDDQTFTVLFDPATGLPARIRTLDYDNIWGDVTYDLVLSGWQTFDGLKVATSRTYELNGRPVVEIKLTDVRINAPVAPDRVAIPPAFRTGASGPATGAVPYQWVIRRQFIGTYLDSDVPSYDTRATTGLRLVELAPGVQHVVGGTHHSLLVELRDHLIVFDAPVSDGHSNWVLGAARAKYGDKPVKYLVLTHHHMDHAGGLRAYAAQGATLVVGKGAREHFRRVLAAPFTRNPDLAARDLSATEIVEVADRRVFTDGRREVHAYLLDNPHAAATLIGYVPSARLGYVTDVWSPGAAPLPATITPPLAALVAGVKRAGIVPVRFAGGHGATADYASLAALATK